MTTFKLPEPTAWFVQGSYATTSWSVAEIHAEAGKKVEPLYTAQVIKDVLEQAAKRCESMQAGWSSDHHIACATAIRKMIGEIK